MFKEGMRFLALDGLTPYDQAHQFQLDLVEKRIRDEIPDTILFLEHPATITRGKGLQYTGEERPKHTPMGPLTAGTAYYDIERGGDLTWHGPGQLVIYPIVKLTDQNLGNFLRFLEKVLIEELHAMGIAGAGRKEKSSGVWIGGRRKIASLGVAVKQWVTYHGVAINVVNSMDGFRTINPCGFDPDVMCRLQDLVTQDLGPSWRTHLQKNLTTRWSGGEISEPETITLSPSVSVKKSTPPEDNESDRLVCFCHVVTRGEIKKAIAEGAKTLTDIQDKTLASTGCGGCANDVVHLLTVQE